MKMDARTAAFFQMVRDNVVTNTPWEFTLLLKSETNQIAGQYTIKRAPNCGGWDAEASDLLGPNGTKRVLLVRRNCANLRDVLKGPRAEPLRRALGVAAVAGVMIRLHGLDPEDFKVGPTL